MRWAVAFVGSSPAGCGRDAAIGGGTRRLAAVLVALAAFFNPTAFGIADAAGQILTVSRIGVVRHDGRDYVLWLGDPPFEVEREHVRFADTYLQAGA